MAEGDRTSFLHRRPFVPFPRQVLAILLQDGMEDARLVLLQPQQRAVIGERFGEPHVAVALPQYRIAPPLMGGLVGVH